ncbi:polysaccharide lyase family 7 protein [Pseudomonas sp. BN414]|uniref:polysaccharide lyase family 7 protein n=1 Tax=Pseudomonas sp. BN414 TaxID=2567888 RepID=UPI0024537B95|nr:polysaccharide lyase family 7 protein [Pseudomonas sp. BN414]
MQILPSRAPHPFSSYCWGPALLGCLLAGNSQADLYKGVAPGGNFALENWNITVPQDADGGTSGTAVTVRPDQLSGPYGYESRWFRTDSQDGAMTFWAPVNGATAGGSSSPRAELREMLDPSNLGMTWNGAGESVQDALLKVTQVPSDGIVIVGQVHGYGSAPLILVYYRYDAALGTGRVIAKLQGTPVQGPPYTNHVLATDVDLGETFSYQMRVGKNVAMASANGGAVARMVMDPSWNGETFYFKAGAYLHMHGSSATEGGRVKFYRLAASHPNDGLQINSPAALPSAAAGQPYLAQLYSTGGRGGATWRLVSGHPPAGLKLSRDGVVSGTPETRAVSPVAHWFVAQVSDVNGSTHHKKFSILVRE